ncbi:hypothetical protein DPMN_080261 [Dreissena polymorpha]|uniref:Uncharacterized protein n=1 Tax=Dreissena polymorpha TaxID=45954 RepID=A0A9D4BJ30_DREPO|nr:hypothetical protein DPMN_080261 [Dreissena polymorpha]
MGHVQDSETMGPVVIEKRLCGMHKYRHHPTGGHHQRRLGRQLPYLREGGIGDKGRPGCATTRVVLASVGHRQRTEGRARVICAAVSKIRWTPPGNLRSGENYPCRGGVDTWGATKGSRT